MSSEPTDLASEIFICDPKYVKVSEDDCCRWIYYILWWTGRPGVCSPWGREESDTTEPLKWTDVIDHSKEVRDLVYVQTDTSIIEAAHTEEW